MIWPLFLSLNVFATTVTVGKFYPLGKVGGEPLFTQRTEIKKDGDGRDVQTSQITNAKGEVVMSEDTVYRGLQLISQKMEQRQSGHVWELAVEGPELTFKTSKDRAPASVEKENIDGTLLNGPLTRGFVHENWERLSAGEKLKVRFPVFEIGSTVGLTLRKLSAGPEGMVVEMRPSNLVLSMFVEHLEMTFDNVRHQLTRYRGRTPLRGESGKPLDLEITYQEVSP